MTWVWIAVGFSFFLWLMGNNKTRRTKANTRSRRKLRRSDSVIFGIDNVLGLLTLAGIVVGILMLLSVIPFDAGVKLMGAMR